MAGEHFPKSTKPFAVGTRAFHRINAPNYDVAVDSNTNRIGAKVRPTGLARESGARGPEAFKDSGFLADVTRLFGKIAKAGLNLVPIFGQFTLLLNNLLKRATGTDPIDFLFKELGKLISESIEGALFARYLRSIPSWVPVGRIGYSQRFVYRDDGTARETVTEEEREIEGTIAASYGLSNDAVFTQWTQSRHWSFQVVPDPGFAYLIGRGNTPDPSEEAFIKRRESRSNDEEFRPVLNIYGQNPNAVKDTNGAIECLMDIGAVSKAIGDGGTHGVMYDANWPYWPMTGDHFWATGRWAYDCMRATPLEKTEMFPTQINPLKAFAASRFEGVKFAENLHGVPATRFFFYATTEGGYTEHRTSTDRKGKTHESGITLGDRDYEFIVDLPPHDEGREPYAIGATIDFPLNRLVLRPRLLMTIRQAPFDIGSGKNPVADGLEFVTIDPIIDILRPADPNKRPSQVRVTIPLSKLPKPSDATKHRAVGVDIAFGWHDPSGDDASKIFKVTVVLREPKFFSQAGVVRLATAINGQWHMHATSVKKESGDPGGFLPNPRRTALHTRIFHLPADAPLSVITSGTWLHGFGEFIEGNSNSTRRLFVGGLLVDVNDETKKRIQKFIDDARKTVNDIRKTAADVKDPKGLLRAQLQKQLDELRATNADPKIIAALEQQINALVNDLPDTPDAFRNALDAFDGRLSDILSGLGALEDFFKITDNFIGERFFPGWHDDIDAAPKTGLEESKRVSAIARSMFLRPTPILNRADEPMGWAEWVDTKRTPIGRLPIGALLAPGPFGLANVQSLLDLQRTSGNAELRIRMVAPQMSAVGSGNNLAQKVNHPDDRTDYDFEVDIRVEPQGTLDPDKFT